MLGLQAATRNIINTLKKIRAGGNQCVSYLISFFTLTSNIYLHVLLRDSFEKLSEHINEPKALLHYSGQCGRIRWTLSLYLKAWARFLAQHLTCISLTGTGLPQPPSSRLLYCNLIVCRLADSSLQTLNSWSRDHVLFYWWGSLVSPGLSTSTKHNQS